MSEVATSVLHNAGNVLNSVNVSSSMISEKIRDSKVPNIAKAVSLMRPHESDLLAFLASDPKGKQLLGYLSNLATHLAQEQEEILSEAASSRKKSCTSRRLSPCSKLCEISRHAGVAVGR